MTARLLLHPTTTLLASRLRDTLAECGPMDDEALSTLLGAPLPAVRSVLAALWTAELIHPTTLDDGTEAWFTPEARDEQR